MDRESRLGALFRGSVQCELIRCDSLMNRYVDLSLEFTADTSAVDAPVTPVKGDSSDLPSGSDGNSDSSKSQDGVSSKTESAGGSTATGSEASASKSESRGESTATGGSSAGDTTPTGSSSTGSSDSSSSASSSSTEGLLSYAIVIKIHAICAASAW